ncbi:hypothetical protein D3C76_1795790 [compost metagenome]
MFDFQPGSLEERELFVVSGDESGAFDALLLELFLPEQPVIITDRARTMVSNLVVALFIVFPPVINSIVLYHQTSMHA